jgi:hypothetical protein
MNGIGWLALGWLSVVGATLAYFRRDLRAIWHEPVLRQPVMIIESDDWGAGPVAAQAAALDRLEKVLSRHRDRRGRHPAMTLALVLAVPDGRAIGEDGRYHRRLLDDPLFAPVRRALEQGRSAGVFVFQLHGLEHYWPAGLMASTDPSVGAWLTAERPAATESLPPPLQSRWVDASVLPSRSLEPAAISEAVAEEVRVFERILGERPRVAVPPTFVWTEAVERAWAREGIEFVVTPGLRSACRDASGLPACDSGTLRNGQRGAGVTYVVRDDYFEPERGHRAERALAALANKREQGRACLLETHRSNFIGDAAVAGEAANELDRLLVEALGRHPALCFLSTEELGRAMRQNDPDWIEQRLLPRIHAWRARVRRLGPFWRMARLTGLAWVI